MILDDELEDADGLFVSKTDLSKRRVFLPTIFALVANLRRL